MNISKRATGRAALKSAASASFAMQAGRTDHVRRPWLSDGPSWRGVVSSTRRCRAACTCRHRPVCPMVVGPASQCRVQPLGTCRRVSRRACRERLVRLVAVQMPSLLCHSWSVSTRRAWIGLILAALLATQMLGLLHRLAHPHGNASSAVPAFAKSAATQPLSALFDQHEVQGDCRLFDQMSHADMTGFQQQLTHAASLADSPVVVHTAWHIACQAVGALARGPPVLS